MDASYKMQRGIHVHLIQFFMCPEFWVHIKKGLRFLKDIPIIQKNAKNSKKMQERFCNFAGLPGGRSREGILGITKRRCPARLKPGAPALGRKQRMTRTQKSGRCRTGYVRERREKKNQPVISLTLTLRFSRKERVQASAVAMAARAASPVIRGRNSQGTGSP